MLLATSAFALNPGTPASGYALRGWQSENGLPANRVRCLWQTPDGFLWVGTDRGLARFDGVTFQVFNETTDATWRRAIVYGLVQTADDTLWAATSDGLYQRSNGRFRRYGAADGLAADSVRTVALQPDGGVIAAGSKGINLLRGGRVETPPSVQQKVAGNVRAYAVRPDGTIYIGGETGLCRVTPSGLEALSGTKQFPGRTYACALNDPDGRFWIGSNVGLHCLNPDGSTRFFGVEQGLTSPRVQCIELDRDGNVWIGTTGGLFRLHNDRIEPAFYPEGFGAATILALEEDNDGSLWVASSVGLYRLRDVPVATIGVPQGLGHTMVRAVLAASDGTWLFGTWGGGLYRYAANRAERDPLTAAAGLDQIGSLAEDDTGALWLAGWSGLFRLADGKLTDFTIHDAEAARRARKAKSALPGIAHSRINTIVPAAGGGVWVTTRGAVYRSRGDTFDIVAEGKGLPDADFLTVVEASDGRLWTVTPSAVGWWENDAWHIPAGIPAIHPRSACEDTEHSLWVATEGEGLLRLKAGRWRHYTTADGLPVNDLVSVVEQAGVVMVGSSLGLILIPVQEFDLVDAQRGNVLHVRTITKADGMPVSDCNGEGWPKLAKTTDGRLLVPTGLGVAVVDARRPVLEDAPPPVRVLEVRSGEAAYDPRQPIALPPGNPGIEFRYGTIKLTAPEKVRFRVRLSPLDEEWHDAADRREIRYPRLQHGRYVFEAAARNSDGVWGPDVARVEFVVRPQFYQTAWFRGGVLVAAAGCVLAGYRWRERRLRQQARALQRQNAELEQRVAERTAELERSYASLRASEFFYHSLVESLPQIIFRKDVDGRITYANEKAADLFRRPLRQLIGATARDVYADAEARLVQQKDAQVLTTGQPVEQEMVLPADSGHRRYFHVKRAPIVDDAGQVIGLQALYWDMTLFRRTEEQLRQAQKDLIEASRRAGVAEMAAGVLHNIGNALNSVNTSAGLAAGRARQLRLSGLSRVAAMLGEQRQRLGEFFSADPRAAQVPEYLAQFSTYLEAEQAELVRELDALNESIQGINRIVAAQEAHARVAGVTETVDPAELVEFAFRVNEAQLVQSGLQVTRAIEPVPPVQVERHKVVRILTCLLRNAAESCLAAAPMGRCIALAVRRAEGHRVAISVGDDGVGLAPEQLVRVFAFGTADAAPAYRSGLHDSAVAAQEMGGSLRVDSEGPGKGATFTLELPAAQ